MSVFRKDNKFFMSDKIVIMHGKLNPDNPTYPEHYHDFVEFVYILKGSCVHVINQEAYPVKRGDIVIINYNQSHSFFGSPDTEFVEILMKPEYINEALINQENAFALLNLSEFENFREILDMEKRCVSFSTEQRRSVEQTIMMMEKELEAKAPGYELAIKSQFNFFIIMLFRKMSLLSHEEKFIGISKQLLLYIRQHANEKLTLPAVAEKCWYNPTYFSRLFKEHTGMTFTAYLNKIRIENATALLRSTDMRIEDICFTVGFSDKSRFYKCFQEHTKLTPYQYRKSKK